MSALVHISLQLEMAPQAFVYVEIDAQVVATAQNRHIKRMQAAGDDEIIGAYAERMTHFAGLMVVMTGKNRLAIDQRDQIVCEALEIICHWV